MINHQPIYRKHLSKEQLRLLKIIGKFRFATIPLLSEWLEKNTSTVYERLLVLESQGYLLKRYDGSYRLRGKPAVYALRGKGIRILRDTTNTFSESVYRNQYKNPSASEALVDQSLKTFKLCLRLRTTYADKFDYFSKSEMARFDDVFIRPLSDLYIRSNQPLESTTDSKENTPDHFYHYQIELLPAGLMTWIIRKRINAHQEWYDENNGGEWHFTDSYPYLLLVCDNDNTEKRIHKLTDDSLLDFDVFTTTVERLESNISQIWLQYWDDDEFELAALGKQ